MVISYHLYIYSFIIILTLDVSYIGFTFSLLKLLPVEIYLAVCSHTAYFKHSHFCSLFINDNILSQSKTWRAALSLGKGKEGSQNSGNHHSKGY